MGTAWTERRTDELRVRHRRVGRAGLAVSLLFHLLLVLLVRGDGRPPSPYAAAGPRAGDDRAAPAGGGMRAMNLRTVAPREERRIPRPPEPVPAPDVTVEPEVLPEPDAPAVGPPPLGSPAADAGAGAKEGPGTGAGVEGGDGRGDGGTAEEGRFRVVPPSPRGLILPPSDRPERVRGKEVEVWVFVSAEGRVVPDSTRLVPSSGDGKFDRRLESQAAEWVFEPARRDGKPVAEWFRYVIIL